jgi:hypothetical protein
MLGAVGRDPVTGRVIQRSVTFYGSAAEVEHYRAEIATEYARRRGAVRAAPMLTIGELLERWLAADHPRRVTTSDGYRSNASYRAADRELAGVRGGHTDTSPGAHVVGAVVGRGHDAPRDCRPVRRALAPP